MTRRVIQLFVGLVLYGVGCAMTVEAGPVPAQGEVIDGPEGLSFEVLDSDQRRVKRLTIRRRDQTAPEEAAMEPG